MSAKIEIYTADNCAYCVRAKMLLQRKGVQYTEIDVSQDSTRFAEMVQRSGNRSVPQIFINDEKIGGFNELWDLDKHGNLANLLT